MKIRLVVLETYGNYLSPLLHVHRLDILSDDRGGLDLDRLPPSSEFSFKFYAVFLFRKVKKKSEI